MVKLGCFSLWRPRMVRMASKDVKSLWVTSMCQSAPKLQLRLSPREKLIVFNQDSQGKMGFQSMKGKKLETGWRTRKGNRWRIVIVHIRCLILDDACVCGSEPNTLKETRRSHCPTYKEEGWNSV